VAGGEIMLAAGPPPVFGTTENKNMHTGH